MPISVFLFSVFGPISDLLLLIHDLCKKCFWQRGKKLFFFSKNTIKIVFFKGSPPQYHPKTCFTNWQLVCHKKVYFIKISGFLVPFLPSNHCFCKAKSFLEKVRVCVPGFLGETLIGQKWCTLSWLFSNESQILHRK